MNPGDHKIEKRISSFYVKNGGLRPEFLPSYERIFWIQWLYAGIVFLSVCVRDLWTAFRAVFKFQKFNEKS